MSFELEADLDGSLHAAFRETFFEDCMMSPDSVAAFRQFSKHLYSLALEGAVPGHYATPGQARGAQLRAVAADLRYLSDHLKRVGSYYDDDGDFLDSDEVSPRDRRWTRYAARLSKRLSTIVSAIETELTAGLEEDDD